MRLQRDIELSQDGELTFTLGFSDELTLQVDGQEVYHGENLWHNTPVWSERGYVSLDQQLTQRLTKGRHRLTTILKMKEYFGYGMALRVEGNNYQFLPARLVR